MARPSSFLARKPRDSSPRGVDLAARDLWKLTAIAVVVNAVLVVGAYGISSFTHTDGIPLIFIWFPLYLCAALPHLIEMSVRPFWSSRPRFEDGSIVIPGNHQSIALVTTGFLLYAFAGWTMAAGFTTGQPFHAAIYVFAAASMAYLECTRNPGKDLVIALSDKQKTTLTPREFTSTSQSYCPSRKTPTTGTSPSCGRITSPSMTSSIQRYFSKPTPTHTAGRGASPPSASASPSPASTLSCGTSTSTPRTGHSWPHRKASTSSTTSSPRPAQHSQPHKGATHEHQEAHPRDADRRGPGRDRHLPDAAPRIPRPRRRDPHPPAVLPGLGQLVSALIERA